MVLEELTLQQFRRYTKNRFTFSPGVTVIIGQNTAGKTNILEAINYLATGKSFRADTDREAIRWDAQVARIVGKGSDTALEVMITTGLINGKAVPTKKYIVNGISRRMVDFVGNLKVVLFWPEHLDIVTDSPSIRRKYLDSVLIQIDREYRRNLISYERGLRQRNSVLDLIAEGKAGRHQLLFWNQLLIKSGGYLTEARSKFLHFVNETEISGGIYQIDYDKSIISDARLSEYAMQEIAAGSTLVGPHRDDFHFEFSPGGTAGNFGSRMDLAKFGSRAEQRLGVLWLKLAEVSYVQSESGERPVLLLDDIFSELDAAHRELVIGIIENQQTVITSAEESILSYFSGKNGVSLEVIRLR